MNKTRSSFINQLWYFIKVKKNNKNLNLWWPSDDLKPNLMTQSGRGLSESVPDDCCFKSHQSSNWNTSETWRLCFICLLTCLNKWMNPVSSSEVTIKKLHILSHLTYNHIIINCGTIKGTTEVRLKFNKIFFNNILKYLWIYMTKRKITIRGQNI